MSEVSLNRKKLLWDFVALVAGGLPLVFSILAFTGIFSLIELYKGLLGGMLLVISLISIPLTVSLREGLDEDDEKEEDSGIFYYLLGKYFYFIIVIPIDFFVRLILVLKTLNVRVN